VSNLDKAIKMLKKAKEETQKELGKQAHKLADSGKALSDKILAGYYQAINKIDEVIDNISSKAKKSVTKPAEGQEAPKKRGRKPAVKVAAVTEEKPKRGRKAKVAVVEEQEAPKKTGRKPAAKKAVAKTTAKKPAAKKPVAKKAGRKRAKGAVDSPIALVRNYLSEVHEQIVSGSISSADVIKHLVEQGINRNTASTQYYAYRRQNGVKAKP
jgi:hypothetical protein